MTAFPVSNNFLSVLKNWSPKLSGLSKIIEDFIGQFHWIEYDGVITCSGSMTFTVGNFKEFKYYKIRNTVWINGEVAGTTGGTASNGMILPIPTSARAARPFVFHGIIFDSTSVSAYGFLSGEGLLMRKYDASNFGLGANRNIKFAGFYEVA